MINLCNYSKNHVHLSNGCLVHMDHVSTTNLQNDYGGCVHRNIDAKAKAIYHAALA